MLSQSCPKLSDQRQRVVTALLLDAWGGFRCILGSGWKREGFLQKTGVEGLVRVVSSLLGLSAIPWHLLREPLLGWGVPSGGDAWGGGSGILLPPSAASNGPTAGKCISSG